MKCDFCTSDNPIKVYITEPFDVLTPIVHFIDDGEWAACDECSELIDTGLKEALVWRALFENRVGSVQRATMMLHLDVIYTQFFDGLKGQRPI